MSTVSTTTSSPSVDDDGGTGRLVDASKWRLLAVVAAIVLYTEVFPLQAAMVGAGVQKITKSFQGVGANISWTMIIVALVGASTTPLLGKMADIWGKRRLFLTCGALFIVGSVICALTSNWVLFLVGRGLSAATIALQVIAYGLLRDLLPRKYVALGLGASATGLGFSALLGPIVAGYLVDNFDWRAMFWFLAAFSLVMTPVVRLVVPESTLRVKERLDLFGAALLAAGVALVLIYLDKGQGWGWSRTTTLAWVMGGIVLLGLFFVVELRARRPIMNMKLLVSPKMGAVLILGFLGAGILQLQAYSVGYMTQVPPARDLKTTVAHGVVDQAHHLAGVTLPMSAVHVALDPGYTYGSGFSLLQFAVRMGILLGVFAMIFGPIGALLARRIGARIPAIAALLIMGADGAAYAAVSYSWITFAVLNAIFGVGVGLFYSSSTILLVDAVPQEEQGIGAGMFGVVQSIGAALILAVSTAVLNDSPVTAHIDVMGHSITRAIPQIFADRGYTISFWIAAGASALGVATALVMRHGRQPTTSGAAAVLGANHAAAAVTDQAPLPHTTAGEE